MKNPFRQLLQATRLARKKPVSAALQLQRIVLSALPKPKRAKAAAKRMVPVPPSRGVRPAAGSFVEGKFACAQGQLAYRLYTPQGGLRRNLPMIVMLHGCTQTAQDFATGTGMNLLADELGFLVLYPEQSRLANLNRCWNWHRRGDRKRGKGEPAVIAGLTRHAIAISKANPARVYIAGISAGGIAAANVGAAYPDVYAAIGVHSGLVAGDTNGLGAALAVMRGGPKADTTGKTARPLPTIVFQGDKDHVVHPSNASGFADLLRRSSVATLVEQVEKAQPVQGHGFTRTIYGFGKDAPLLEEWIVHGNGHAWSGGRPGGSFAQASGPDASREMARFFLARKRAAPRARPAAKKPAASP